MDIQQQIIAVPGVPTRPYADLQAGVDGQVFYMEGEDDRARDQAVPLAPPRAMN